MAITSWISFTLTVTLGLYACVGILETHGASVDTEKLYILREDALKVMQQDFTGFNSLDAFKKSRYFLPAGNTGRERMQAFIRYKFSSNLGLAGGKEAGHVLHERPFTTTIKTSNNKLTQVNGINYVAILNQKDNRTTEDKPLIILANYDTDSPTNAENPIEENGSGIAALLVLGDKLAADIQSGKIKLKYSIILAAVDASLEKYHPDGAPLNATTGAGDIASKFLPEFLNNRPKGIRGVIVLDNLMNFQAAPQTQHTLGFDRSYPEAYQEISRGNFAGDFLALVARGDDLDRSLVETFELMWNKTRVQFKSDLPNERQQGGNAPQFVDPRLIKFIHDVQNGQGEGYLHFLKSDQTSFWNHKSETIPPYPAILLTDTRSYRSPVCAPDSSGYCENFEQTTSVKNLEFSHRAILTVYETAVRFQSGAASHVSGILTIIPMFIVAVRHFRF